MPTTDVPKRVATPPASLPKATFDFDPDTADGAKRAITEAFYSSKNIRIWLGDPLTGQAWLEEFDVRGRVGRSTGVIRAPLLLSQRRSIGGAAILTRHVLRVDYTTGKTLYQHPQFKHGLEGCRIVPNKLTRKTYVDVPSGKPGGWTAVSGFDTEQGARNWVAFMVGERYNK